MPKPKIAECSIADAVSNAYGDITALAEGIRDTLGNMEEKFSSTERYSRLEEIADTLESIDEPTPPDGISERRISFPVVQPKSKRKGLSRSDERDNICAILSAVIDDLANMEDDDVTEFAESCQSIIDELNGIDFPGWRG
jgi:hypothetical protein